MQQLCSISLELERDAARGWMDRMALDDALFFGGKYSLKQIIEVQYIFEEVEVDMISVIEVWKTSLAYYLANLPLTHQRTSSIRVHIIMAE